MAVIAPRDTDAFPQDFFTIREADVTPKARKRVILRTCLRHGLELFLKEGGTSVFRNRGANLSDTQKARIAQNLRIAFEHLGPTFIKLGQVLSTRQDILPDFICDEFTMLLDRLAPAPFEEMLTVLERDLPQGVETFRSIDANPIGSASLATVYRAELQDGRRCAVKVVRPNVSRLFQTDIQLVKQWANRVFKHLPERLQATINLNGLLNDYWSSSLEECDMRQEAEHMAHHARIMTRYERVRVPEVLLQPTRNVLVMEFIDGWSLKDFPIDEISFDDRFELMFDLAHYYIESLLDGYYHADPHASNILIEQSTKQAVVIDWGMVGRMDAQTAHKLLYMVSLINQNLCEEAAEVGLQIVEPTEYTDVNKLRETFVALAPKYAFALQGQTTVNWGTAITEVIQFGIKNGCRIPSGLALWTKGWMATEATARWLLPEISYHRVVESYDTNILRNVLSRQLSYKTNGFSLAESARFASALPRRLNMIFEKLALNGLGGYVELRLSASARSDINRMVNRELTAKICVAAFITSALFGVAAGVAREPRLGNWMGIAAALAGLLGVLSLITLAWTARRSRRR